LKKQVNVNMLDLIKFSVTSLDDLLVFFILGYLLLGSWLSCLGIWLFTGGSGCFGIRFRGSLSCLGGRGLLFLLFLVFLLIANTRKFGLLTKFLKLDLEVCRVQVFRNLLKAVRDVSLAVG